MMKTVRSNKKPGVVGWMFLDLVLKLGVIPEHLRVDCGTETDDMALIQVIKITKGFFLIFLMLIK